MKNNKILYLCPNYPFPANSGGLQCLRSHVEDIASSKYARFTKYIFCTRNVDNEKIDLDIDYDIVYAKFSKTPSINNKIKRLLALFSKLPFYTSLNIDKDANKIDVKKINPGLIILDDLRGLVFLPKNKNYKLVYIAHNLEYEYELDLARLEKGKIFKILQYIDAFKMKFLEKEILKKADKIVCVSTSDCKVISSKYKEKTILMPHKIKLQKDKWVGSSEKTLFFCGPAWFQPNLEAIEWIVNELAPVLSKDTKIKIAGKYTDELPQSLQRDNVEFLGFVSKEELYDLYKTSSAFLCPIVYGSGVKIKLTEAIGYGTPVIATPESLEGLDYLDIKPLIDRNDLQKTKQNIEELLSNKEKLHNYSKDLINQVESFQNENDITLEKIIGEYIDEQSV